MTKVKEPDVVRLTVRDLKERFPEDKYSFETDRQIPGVYSWEADVIMHVEDHPLLAVECKGQNGDIRKAIGQAASYLLAVPTAGVAVVDPSRQEQMLLQSINLYSWTFSSDNPEAPNLFRPEAEPSSANIDTFKAPEWTIRWQRRTTGVMEYLIKIDERLQTIERDIKLK